MKSHAIVLILLCFAYPIAGQTEIYKCATEGAVTYQDTPCTGGQTMIALVETSLRGPRTDSNDPPSSKEDSPARWPSKLAPLFVGMTDTEVLNLRGWGPPKRITRSRTNRAWREEWTYLSPTDGRWLLQFANGRLTAIDAVAAAGWQAVR
jgi:hypothetical protein